MEIETLDDDYDSGPDAFVDTAAVMASLDLVITCDTAVAHLAGALGVPAWVVLKTAPDWRWLLGRSDSPWYPPMRLFRQPSPGDWKGAFAAVDVALQERLSQHDAASATAPVPRTKPDVAVLFERALNLHRAGKLPEAQHIYREILRHQPRHF